jgi:ADP-heptose:LPS heptosyltransferase
MEYGIEAKMSSKNPITLIIADFSPQVSITDCLKNIDSWSPRKIVISNNLKIKERLSQYPSFEFVYCESISIFQLWERGIKESKTRWNLLITSNEVVTGRLKISIESQIKNNPNTEKLFKINKKVIFLKKVLKYPLEWACEFPSSLVFIPEVGNFTLESGLYSSSPFLTGELVHFSDSSLNGNVQEVVRLSEIEADYIYKSHTTNNLVVLTFKSFLKAGINFFRNLIFKKGFREGYEGIIFSIFGGIVPLLGLLRYCEKYYREGKIIENNLSEIKNILIIKLGGIGDVILVTPMIRNIKKLIPQAQLHILVLEGLEPLLKNNPYIDSTSTINFKAKPQKIKNIASSFRQQNIDLAINLQSTKFSSKLLNKISSRWKINRSYFFRDKDTDVLVGFTNTYRSVIERDFDVLRAIGLNPDKKYTEVFLDKSEIAWAKEYFLLNGLSDTKTTVVIHPGSSLKIRSWGIEKYAQLCRKLILESNCQILINCSPKELDEIVPIKDLTPEVCVFSGALRELLSLIHESDLFIGNDSGPSHCSAALNIPTITLNGPSTSSFYRDPDIIQGKHYTFNKEAYCRDLFHSQCMTKTEPVNNHPVCDEMICLEFTVEEVAKKARDLITLIK